MGYSSNNNAILVNNCGSLKNLIVTLQTNSDLITQGNNGFSLQLNCYPQTNPQTKYQNVPLKWMQYVINLNNDSVEAGIQYWSQTKGDGFSPNPNYVSFASAPSNQVLRGSAMRIALATDSNNNVTTATFGLTSPDFTQVYSHTFNFPSNCLCSIYGFQVNLVGPGDDTHTCTFTNCLGILTYSASDSLAVQTVNKCGGGQPITGETSNTVYGDVASSGAWDLSQNVGIS